MFLIVVRPVLLSFEEPLSSAQNCEISYASRPNDIIQLNFINSFPSDGMFHYNFKIKIVPTTFSFIREWCFVGRLLEYHVRFALIRFLYLFLSGTQERADRIDT